MDNPNLSYKPLRHSDDPEEYKLYKAALEWGLVDPIVIEKREDFKSEYKWKDRIEPYHHQVKNLITFCGRLPVTLLADDVGLGKTISAGLVASELISRGRLPKILIVCPKILREQWKEELDTKFGIASEIVTGKDLVTAKIPGDVGAVITTYRSATLYLDQISESGFDMLILDEAHKLRNLHGTEITPQVATRFRKVLADRVFKYVLMLTATPIQNRLWDLYSLVDLLTAARGHENPFGSPGMFARKFISDKGQARKLKPGMQDEFRSIVYGYMSRVRRDDANLHFPIREVQLHAVLPSPEELDLIEVIKKSIKGLDRLTQVGILKTLVSSPEAIVAQLDGMAKRKTVPELLAKDVRDIAKKITLTAKLKGLNALVDKLIAERPDDWRMVVFTTRLETQTTIQNFLESKGIAVGVINGSTGSINQDTIKKFKKDVPEVNVIVSTEAGSEGVNLQAANMLVNYDLPWNPMIVEQRIGRIQRLGSKYEKVCIFNIVLKGTFEEKILGLLMEKLQMAASAIGDIESLLEASGMSEGAEDDIDNFEEKILKLVLKSLEDKNTEEATQKIAKSIADAKIRLKDEETNINSLLGGMDEMNNGGPRCPSLPIVSQSMDAKSFVLAGLSSMGAKLNLKEPNLYVSKFRDKEELVRLDNDSKSGQGLFKSTLYTPGSPAFDRLVNKLTIGGLHRVEDLDINSPNRTESLLENWVTNFGGVYLKNKNKKAEARFSGTALVRVRMTVAHDSYERLVEILCVPEECHAKISSEPINISLLNKSADVGINDYFLVENTKQDQGVSEFCRFYKERLVQELKLAGVDPRKKKKLEDDFTPRLEFALVGIEGFTHKKFETSVSYNFGSIDEYSSDIEVIPSTGEIIMSPKMGKCAITNKTVPQDCLEECVISGHFAIRHLLIKSAISERIALPEYVVTCSVSGKRVLKDEVEESAVSGKYVIPKLLKTSALSGKRAEPDLFGKCEFTGSEVLETELAVSQISGKRYRTDEQLRSVVSGKTGHTQEFIFCSETNSPLLQAESEKSEISGKMVLPGILEECQVTHKRVLPRELEKSSVSGKRALNKFFVSSNISGAKLLESEAIKSITGNFCVPLEAKKCAWSNRECHPEDLKTCDLTGLSIYFEYIITKNNKARFEILANLLDGISRKTEKSDIWDDVSKSVLPILNHRYCKVESAELSPDGKKLAVCVEIKTILGLKLRHGGFIFSIEDSIAVGRIARGKRDINGWTAI